VVPPDVELTAKSERELELGVAALGGYPVAARSSGHLEDLPGASFAGQYVTHLGIRSTAELVDAIRDCRESARSPQVVAYLRKNRLDESQARVSVLVQRMVDAAVAGVAFSVHPTTGREDHALLECCRGLGEKLVSGRTAPTRYVLNLADAAPVERESGDEHVDLPAEMLRELRTRVLELQAHFGAPQDIEWAIDAGGALWILQSRPITRIQWRCDIPEFTSADFREGGVSARVCTPLMYSLYRDAVQLSMPRYFADIKLLPKGAAQQTWIDMFYGRPYWSASAVKQVLLKVPGFDERVFDTDLGIQKDYGESGPGRTPTSVRTVLPAIPVAIALERTYRRHLRATDDYGRAFAPQEARFLRTARSFAGMTDAAFFAALREVLAFHLQTECDYFTTIYNNANFQSDLKKLLHRIERISGEQISAVALMSGLQDVSHMKVQRDLVRLVAVAKRDGIASAGFDSGLAEFLSHHYFHGDAELDISVPRWGERPERVRQIVDDILRSGIDPKDPERSAEGQFQVFSTEERRVLAAIRRSTQVSRNALAALLGRRFSLARSFRRRLRLARIYLRRREEMREYSTRAYNVVRQFVLEAGARLQKHGYLREIDDVFMLQTQELTHVGDRLGGSGPRDGVEVLATTGYRRLMYRGYRLLEPPGELGRNVSQRSAADHVADSSGRLVLTGIGCSAGVVTASVRVVPTLEQAQTLQPGEILVTRFTDPGWTPILGLVSGIVTEVGGLLSHAAVIGREYGIPAVLNVPGATQLLRTGQRIEVDGNRGTVTVIAGDMNPPEGGFHEGDV
jgi:phosphohistidine swiveling domain-containing protein